MNIPEAILIKIETSDEASEKVKSIVSELRELYTSDNQALMRSKESELAREVIFIPCCQSSDTKCKIRGFCVSGSIVVSDEEADKMVGCYLGLGYNEITASID